MIEDIGADGSQRVLPYPLSIQSSVGSARAGSQIPAGHPTGSAALQLPRFPIAPYGKYGIMSRMVTRTDLTVDSRGRISVTRLGFEPSSTVVAETLPDGSVVLRRARVLTEAEIDLLANPEAMAAVRRGLSDAEQGRFVEARRRPHRSSTPHG